MDHARTVVGNADMTSITVSAMPTLLLHTLPLRCRQCRQPEHELQWCRHCRHQRTNLEAELEAESKVEAEVEAEGEVEAYAEAEHHIWDTFGKSNPLLRKDIGKILSRK
jgi:hypothetical protein